MKKLNINLFFLILISILISGLCQVTSAQDVSDFDADTIQGEEFLSSDKILPVELVEEQNLNQVATKTNDTDLATQEETQAAEGKDTAGPSSISKQAKVDLSQMTTILNVSEIEISALIKSISKLTDRNYIIDNNVKGKISINLNTPVTIEEALKIFDTVLLLRGFTTVPVDKNIWKVVPVAAAKQTTIPLHLKSPDRPTDTFITQVIRLKHVAANDIQQLLQQFISNGGSITSFSGTNALIIIDSSANIERLAELVDLLDTPASDQDITIIPIINAEVADVAEKINQILGTGESSSNQQNAGALAIANRTGNPALGGGLNQNARGGATGGGSGGSQSATSSSIERNLLPVKIIADERTNSLIVVADEAMTTKVKALAEQLDSKIDLSSGRFYVYNVKHADAEKLAEILNNLISGNTETTGEGADKTTGSSLSRSNTSNTTGSSATNNTANAEANRTRERIREALLSRNLLRTGGKGAEAAGKVNFEGEVSLSSDPATNTIIINASKTDYLRIKDVIDELDIQRRQVLVEATLIEVTLSDEQALGIELQGTFGGKDLGGLAQSSFGTLNSLLLGAQSSDPAALSSALTDLTLAAASTGTVTLPSGIVLPSQAVLVKALSNVSNVNVLSSPTILAMDNEEAEIIVGENVPFVTSRSTDTANIANTFNSIERQDVGITLRITPQISAGDFVVLSIFVEISNVVPATRTDPNGPTTTIRTAETMVEVQNGQMIATGGLISDNVTDAARGIPFLKDIPVLGNLFKREDTSRRRTNLLVLITPKIASDQFEAREQTIDARSTMEDAIGSMKMENNPSRSDVLRNDTIDYVVEELPAEEDEKMPTSITPAKNRQPDLLPEMENEEKDTAQPEETIDSARENARKRFMAEEPAPEKKTETEEELDISVSPELPEIE